MRKSGCYYTVVVEDVAARKVVATATLLVEYKFIRGGNLCGHVEDVVVDASQRGKKLGVSCVSVTSCVASDAVLTVTQLQVKLMHALQHIGLEVGCYKVILDCSQDNVEFYKRCGFAVKEVQMAVYLPANESRGVKL
jgi:glucosamine-phosphate N-acetyltransferase